MPSFLHTLLDSPGPSGFETAPARLWRKEAETFADDVRADVHETSNASIFAQIKPSPASVAMREHSGYGRNC